MMDAGRAYHHQALILVEIYLLLVDVLPQEAQYDALFKETVLAIDEALRSATDARKRVTDKASSAFDEALEKALRCDFAPAYSPKDSSGLRKIIIYMSEAMVRAREYDTRPRDLLSRVGSARGILALMPLNNKVVVNFMHLQSPLAHDPDAVVVRQSLTASTTRADVIWNFARLEGRASARFTLENNPQFYLDLPANEGAFGPRFSMNSTKDFVCLFQRQGVTVYVLIDRPGRVFLQTELVSRTFGNVWMLNGTLLFKDIYGRLEGDNFVIGDFIRDAACYCEPLPNSGSGARLNHSCIPAIITTSLASPAMQMTPNDWTFLSQPELGFFNTHIVSERRLLPASTEGMVCLRAFASDMLHVSGTRTPMSDTPSPPTSERPGYDVLYSTMDTLTDDELLGVFSYYRSDNRVNWNTRLEWRTLSHVCRRWRYLVHKSATYLGMLILCTNGTPLVETLVHLPPLPLIVDYRYANTGVSAQDELGILSALQLRYRVRHVVLSIPPSILHQVLVLLDETFPLLESLSLSSTAEYDTTLLLPTTLLAPDLRHLTLLGVYLPNKLQLLSSTPSLLTLTLTNIRASGYFPPQHLVTMLRSLSQLEELSIGFSIPLPRPSAEIELLHELEVPVTLPVLKRLTFRGVGAYLDSFLAQIRAPLLEQLSITLFNQIAFELPHLSHFTNTTEGLRLPIAKITFERDAFSVVADHRTQQVDDRHPSFSLRVICKQFDWQIDCAAQICGALTTMLSGIEQLTLDLDGPGQSMSTGWQDEAVDGATWRELLGPFAGARELRICHALVWELSCALESGDVGLDPGLLPSLDVLAPELEEEHAGNAFASFIDARQVVGRPVRLSPSPVVSHEPPIAFPRPSTSLEHSNPEVNLVPYSPLPSRRPNWLRRTVINPIRNRLG